MTQIRGRGLAWKKQNGNWMPTEYQVYLRTEAFEFLRHRHMDERSRLLRLLRELARDPYRRGDFAERDLSGRDIQVLIFPAIRDFILARSRRQGTQSHRHSIRRQMIAPGLVPWACETLLTKCASPPTLD